MLRRGRVGGGQCFFFPRENQKNPWKRFFAVFLVFFTGRKLFSRVPFLKISRVGQSFHGYFFRFCHGLRFYFHGLKKGKKWDFCQFHGSNFYIFHAQKFIFHGLDFYRFFTGKTFVSRVVSEKFSRVRLGFHGLKTDFFHGFQKIFHGEKNTAGKRAKKRIVIKDLSP